jgi:antirestriction protein ArdC
MTTPPAAAERGDRVTELMDSLVAGVAQLTTSDDWLRWLDVARRFHRYSFWNTVAILTQRPDATRVAGYQRWKTLERQVRRGERAIRILAPCPRRRTVLDETTGEEETVTRVAGWKVASVFDISQTDGPPLPEPPVWHLDGPDPGLVRHQLAALIRAEDYTFRLGAMPTGHERANGITNFAASTVTVRDDLAPAQTAKTTAHELAHVLLHQPSTHDLDRARQEIEAESVAYLILGASGLDTDAYSFGYVAGWSRGDTDLIRATSERVLACARTVLDHLGLPTPAAPAA